MSFINLVNAVKRGDIEEVESLLTQKIGINAQDHYRKTALHYAAKKSNIEIVKLLLNHDKIDVNARDHETRTALHYATKKGNIEIVKLLLNHDKIDVNVRTAIGIALHVAIEEGNMELVKLLLNHKKIDVNAEGFCGERALHFAAKKGYIDVVKLLLEHGADVSIKDGYGKTALHFAVTNNYAKITWLFLIHGVTLDEDSESKMNEKPELKECLIVLKKIKKMPHLGKLIEINKNGNVEENTDFILGFINDEAKRQELIKEFKAIKKKRPCERLFFILEYLLDLIKHIFLKIFTKNKKVMATQLHESKNDIKMSTESGVILKNLPYEAAEVIVSYFDANTNKAVSLSFNKKVDAFLTKLEEAVLSKELLTKVAVESGVFDKLSQTTF